MMSGDQNLKLLNDDDENERHDQVRSKKNEVRN